MTHTQARECHKHLESILRQLILATPVGSVPDSRRAVYSTQKLASIVSASSTETPFYNRDLPFCGIMATKLVVALYHLHCEADTSSVQPQ